MQKMLGLNDNITSRQIIRQENNNFTNNKILLTGNYQDTTSFCNSEGIAHKVNKFLSDGGLVKSFLILDTCGFILPRIFQALLRNRKEIGGLNWNAGTEEAIREFLSGPGILIIPLASILVARKCFGKAANIDNKTLYFLREKFESKEKLECKRYIDLISTDVKKSKENFYNKIIEDVLNPHYNGTAIVQGQNKSSTDVIKDIQKQVIELDGLRAAYEKAGFFKRFFASKTSPVKKTGNKIKIIEEQLAKGVIDLNNHYRIHTNNKTHISLIHEGKPFELDIRTFSEYLFNYADDVIKRASESFSKGNIEKIIKKLNLKANGGRRILNVAAMIATVGFTAAVPIFYKRYKSFPGTEGLLDKNTNKQPPISKEVS